MLLRSAKLQGKILMEGTPAHMAGIERASLPPRQIASCRTPLSTKNNEPSSVTNVLLDSCIHGQAVVVQELSTGSICTCVHTPESVFSLQPPPKRGSQ
jgi:hypothetical protein